MRGLTLYLMSLQEQPWDKPSLMSCGVLTPYLEAVTLKTWLKTLDYHPLLPAGLREPVVLRISCDVICPYMWPRRKGLCWTSNTLRCDHWVELWICGTLLPASRVPGCSSLCRDEMNALAAFCIWPQLTALAFLVGVNLHTCGMAQALC